MRDMIGVFMSVCVRLYGGCGASDGAMRAMTAAKNTVVGGAA